MKFVVRSAIILLPILLIACSAGGSGSSSSASSTTAGAGGDATSGPGSGGNSAASTSGGMGGGTSSSSTSGAGGSAPMDCKDLPLCDDFEGVAAGGPPDAAKWMVVSPNCSGTGTLTVDGAEAHSGSKSIKVNGGGGYCDHVFIANSAAIAAIGSVAYGRFFVRLGAALGDGHTTFMTMKDSADNNKDLRMGGQSKILMWNRESDDATLPVLSPAGIAKSLSPAANTWLCIEFMVDKSGLLKTWVDGAEVEGLAVDGVATPDIDQQWLNKAWKPSVIDFKLGWESYAGQSMTLWFDDVALAPMRIGCQ